MLTRADEMLPAISMIDCSDQSEVFAGRSSQYSYEVYLDGYSAISGNDSFKRLRLVHP